MRKLHALGATALVVSLLLCFGCGGGSNSTTPPPPPAITVAVTPAAATVNAGLTLQFAATVTNTADTAVTWQVDGLTGGATATGTISASGLYTAPATPPSSAVTVSAVSLADSTKSGSAQVTVAPAVAVAVTPATATVNAGLAAQFAAQVANNANAAVTWQVNGVTGGAAATGTISASGLFTAPPAPPSGAVTVTAVSQVDPTKSGSAQVTVAPPVAVAVTPATAAVNAGLTTQFAAQVANNANASVTWQVNGVTGGAAATGTISNAGLYTAPATPPSGAVTVTAVSQVDPTKSGSAKVTVVPAVGVTVTPATATVNAGLTAQFAAQIANNTNAAVTWQVNGVTGGAATTGTISASGLYTAPATPPSGAVTVAAVSQVDPTKRGSAQVTVVPAVVVTITPNQNVVVAAGASQAFTAAVANASDATVAWQVNGVAGGNAAFGRITAAGVYTAPSIPPVGTTVAVTAVSQADPTKSATVAIADTYANISLKGTYVLALSGTDAHKNTFTALAILTADGQTDSSGFGHISGTEEVIASGAYTGPTALAANCCLYQVLADGRGAMTITGPAGSATYALAMASGNGAVLTDFDQSASIQGTLAPQDPNAPAAALDAAYAFGSPSAIGLLDLATTASGSGSSHGNITGSQDVIVGGALDNDLPLTGIFTLDNTTGRGTAQWTASQGSASDAFYVVDGSHLVLMSTDPTHPGLAAATLQAAPVAALAAGNYVFATAGRTGGGTPAALGLTGEFTLDASSRVSAGVVDGAIGATDYTAAALTGGGATAKSKGEFAFSLQASTPALAADYALWMASPSSGFLLEADANGTASGTVSSQQGAPFPANALGGVFAFRLAGVPAAGQTLLLQGWIAFGNSGAATGVGDLMLDGLKVPTQSFSATYALTDPAHGRFTAVMTFPNDKINGSPLTVDLAGYLIAPAGTTQNPALGGAGLVQGTGGQSWSGQLFQQH